MKAGEGQTGRVFVIRLEDGDVVPGCIERFAEENGISVGYALLVGGIGEGEVVVGPRRSERDRHNQCSCQLMAHTKWRG